VPSIRKLIITMAAIAVAAGLAGCAAVPTPIEEQLLFDKATGADVYQDTSQLRMRGIIGYPRTDCCGPGPVPVGRPY
jgi:starvation-inducible outer membrane lipoprotein